MRTASVPVVVETPGGREGQGADIAWLKENVYRATLERGGARW